MKIEDNVLILDDEVNDSMLQEFISLANKDSLESIIIDSDNISSLVLQQLFCLKDIKKVVCNEPFLEKFFDNIQLVS